MVSAASAYDCRGVLVATRVLLQLSADDEELERGALQLRDELSALDVDRVEPALGGAAPDGTRGGIAAGLGALLVSLNPTVGLLTALVGTVSGWLSRPGAVHSVRLELDGDVLELTGTSSEVQERLAEKWIRAHGLADDAAP
jgi:hypothetical protein